MKNATKKIFPTLLFLLSVSIFSFPEKLKAEIIFQDDFDGEWYRENPDWNCGKSGVPPGWTSKSGCGQEADYQTGQSVWAGEVNPGGRSGNGWFSWRKERFGDQGYQGYLNYDFPASVRTPEKRINQHYARWSMKINPKYDFSMTGPRTWKINRLNIDDSSGKTREIYYGWKGNWESDAVMTISTSASGSPLAGPTFSYSTGIKFSDFLDGKWHSLEFYIDLNPGGGANGKIKIWLDGNLRFSKEDCDFSIAQDAWLRKPWQFGSGNMTSVLGSAKAVFYDADSDSFSDLTDKLVGGGLSDRITASLNFDNPGDWLYLGGRDHYLGGAPKEFSSIKFYGVEGGYADGAGPLIAQRWKANYNNWVSLPYGEDSTGSFSRDGRIRPYSWSGDYGTATPGQHPEALSMDYVWARIRPTNVPVSFLADSLHPQTGFDFPGEGGVQPIIIDDYVVSTEYIGPVSEQDETPPVAPGNMRVR